MARSHVLVPSTGTVKLATYQYTDGANVKDDEVTVLGEPFLPTYSVWASGISTATSLSHALQVMAGASLNVRLRRLVIKERALAGAVNNLDVVIVRLSTAGTGGTAITPMPYDSADVAAGLTAMTLPTVKGTEVGANNLGGIGLGLVAAQPVLVEREYLWPASSSHKPIKIAPGVTNGIAFKIVTGIATSTIDIWAEFSEAVY